MQLGAGTAPRGRLGDLSATHDARRPRHSGEAREAPGEPASGPARAARPARRPGPRAGAQGEGRGRQRRLC